MALTIESISSWLVDIPTIRPHKLSMVTMGCQTLVIVRIRCAGGITGWGEATTIGGLSYGAESPESIKITIDHYLAPLITGRPLMGVEPLAAVMNAGVTGNSFAKCALETAFLDALGKSRNVSVSTLLGGAKHERLPVLWTLASGDTEKDIDEGHRLMSEGRHHRFKLKIGGGHVKDDIRHALKIKSALGADVAVHVDVNQAWDMTTALRAIPELQEGGICMIEQPLERHDLRNLIDLSRRFTVTILADESLTDCQSGFTLASGGFTGAWALKIAKAGGPAQVLKVAHTGHAAGIALYGGTLLEGAIGTVASLHAWATLDLSEGTEMFGPLLLKDDILTRPLDFSQGGVRIPSGPGLGIEVDEEKLLHYARQ